MEEDNEEMNAIDNKQDIDSHLYEQYQNEYQIVHLLELLDNLMMLKRLIQNE